MPELDLLFVYGTLRCAAGGGMHHLLGEAELLGDAHCAGRLYLLDGYPGAVPDDSGGSLVKGELYRLLNPAGTLAVLDAYEECGAAFGDDGEYVRTVATVTREDGTEAQAWIYWYSRPVAGLERIESGDFAGAFAATNRTGH